MTRLLHTGDWHLGKRLYGQDRRGEAQAVLAEVAEVARAERVDAVLVAGDLLDRRIVDAGALEDCLHALGALAEVAPVVAVTGNHDDPDLWAALGPFLRPRRIHVVSRVGAAADVVVTVETAAGPLHAALLPWPTPRGMAAELGTDESMAKSRYADVVTGLVAGYAERLRDLRRAYGGTAVLVGHLMVDGALAGGGEREMTMGITYAVSPQAVPTDLDYVALGHVHRPQAVPGVAAPARYAGSPMALDFSEDNHTKSAVIVESDGLQTVTREVPLTAARPLARLRGGLDELAAAASLQPGAWYLCEVLLVHPVLDLVRQVRERVPDTLRVEPRYPVADTTVESPDAQADGSVLSLPDRYAEWYGLQGRVLPQGLADVFAQAVARAEREAADAG